jgi:hypothetical protein
LLKHLLNQGQPLRLLPPSSPFCPELDHDAQIHASYYTWIRGVFINYIPKTILQ